MLKKIGLVAATTIGLSLAATPAYAAPAAPNTDPVPMFGTAYVTFINGGAALGTGAAELIAGAYAGLVLTPALVVHSFSCPC